MPSAIEVFMKRRSGAYRIGERYLLQFPGGVERMAEVVGQAGGEPVLRPVLFDAPFPPHVLPGGEWQLEPGDRLIRDWTGAHWNVMTSRPSSVPRPVGEIPVACHVHFTRFAHTGERTTYRAASLWSPGELGDELLLSLLRQAWEALETDLPEQRRRSNGTRAKVIEL